MAESALALREHPQIIELLSVLEQNSLSKQKEEVQALVAVSYTHLLDGKKHRRTLNSLVCGGSGAGKSRFYAKPNLLQASHVSYLSLIHI